MPEHPPFVNPTMPRTRSKRSRDRNGNHNRNDANGWSPRGGHSNHNSGRVSKRGRGGGNKHHDNHHQTNASWWAWKQNHHHHGDVESPASDGCGSVISDLDSVDPGQFPPAEDNVFSILLPASATTGTGTVPGKRPACLRPDCKRAKQDLVQIRRRNCRFRRLLRYALEHVGSDLVDFVWGRGEDEDGWDDDDAEFMDWVPEPTVNLIVTATSSPEPATPQQVGLGICCGASPQRQQQSPLAVSAGGSGWTPNVGSDGLGQSYGQEQSHATGQASTGGSCVPIAGTITINDSPPYPAGE